LTAVERTGIRFGIVGKHQFDALPVTAEDGTRQPLGVEQSEALWQQPKVQGYIDAKGKVEDALRTALKDGTLEVPKDLADQHEAIKELLTKLAGRLEFKNADEQRPVRVRQEVYLSDEFNALWRDRLIGPPGQKSGALPRTGSVNRSALP